MKKLMLGLGFSATIFTLVACSGWHAIASDPVDHQTISEDTEVVWVCEVDDSGRENWYQTLETNSEIRDDTKVIVVERR